MDENAPGSGELQHHDIGQMSYEELKNLMLKNNIEIHDDDDDDVRQNYTLSEITEFCNSFYENETSVLREKYPGGFCESVYDTISCWPPTPYNSTAVIRCFKEFNNIRYDDKENASKDCLSDGNWAEKANYSKCKEILIIPPEDEETIASSMIYCVGYSVSLVALVIAIAIFLYYKDLKCLRNRIHTNLMCAYMLLYCTWILMLVLGTRHESTALSISLTITLYYFHLTTFFWMFVEGMYLYILVVQTLRRENFKLRYYVCIGWGFPFIIVLVWAITKAVLIIGSLKEAGGFTWMTWMAIDWIFQGPPAGVLLLNLIFLIAIMYVLITKLRSANNAETKQYWKAAKALLVLMPLLGVTYIITISVPTTVFNYIRAVLLSTQGFMVALFYCFLNTEVQNTVRHHFETWKTSRSLGRRRMRLGSRSKDGSPRSRTESIRATEWTLVSMDDPDLQNDKVPVP
ncbi:diuretic hormone receptor-like isoform X2 [Onthophagus taurus]|uniref:diuretic hormone receptor-like isoform X2 n=1 Tax=Onthophagus taurus TaxID=166361 RepID=UPI000C20D5B8|nr:diuretic hormone receptor-like isoform X2 [Onthophagus taurus]